MSKLHEMTPLQRQFAEEHQNVVFWFLKQKGLPIDDYYDIVISAIFRQYRNMTKTLPCLISSSARLQGQK